MTDKGRILIVDDEESLRFFLDKSLSRLGYTVDCREDGRAGLEVLARERYDLVLLDLKMPRLDGMHVLEELGERLRTLPVVMMTAYGDIRTAVQAMRLGAADFVTKPFDASEIATVVEKVLHTRALEEENEALRALLYRRGTFGALIGKSPRMQALYEAIERIAPTDTTVLIQGESGTGKELVAREIIARSPRADAPRVSVNVTALPDSLLESELFGCKAGAFTGATKDRKGLCQEADGGTLFLDEIGDLPPAVQPKLLRLLQEQEVMALGDSRAVKVDIRFLAATHQDLADRVEEGAFRQDLYFRLNVIPLVVPPLRQRLEDLPDLVGYFMEKHALRLNREPVEIPAEIMEHLLAYRWPGNVRELENMVERILLMAPAEGITFGTLPAEIRAVSTPPPLTAGEKPLTIRVAMARARASYLQKLLEFTGGNVSQAAEIAGISRPNLHRHVKESGLDLEELRKRK